MIKGFSDFMEGISSLYVNTLQGLVATDTVVVEMFLIFHVASRDRVFNKFSNFVGGSFLS